MKTSSPASRSAFTLIELLVVMGIIVLMGALVVPAVSGTLKGTALNQAAQSLQAQFNAAQQNALAKGQTIEMRLILSGDPDTPGADKSDQIKPATFRARGVQLYAVTPNMNINTASSIKQNFTPITKLDFLPSNIVIDKGQTLSTLCDSTLLVTPNGDQTAYLFPKLPRIGTNYTYYRIQFRADGSTNLAPNQQWFLTIHDLSNGNQKPDELPIPPNNFFTISLDPVQGSNRAFRPS